MEVLIIRILWCLTWVWVIMLVADIKFDITTADRDSAYKTIGVFLMIGTTLCWIGYGIYSSAQWLF